MKVKDFIKWLETQDQELEVYVLEKSEEYAYSFDGVDETCNLVTYVQEVCFDDPVMQSSKGKYGITLGRSE